MPLLETIGSGSARGSGMFGKIEFMTNSLYTSATVYAPLIDNRIYTSGTLNGSYSVNIQANGSYSVDSITGKIVLQGTDGGHKFKIPTVASPSTSHSLSIWQRPRQLSPNAGGMLFSKFPKSNDAEDNRSGDPYSYPLNTYDNGQRISLNIGDGDQNPIVNNMTFSNVTTSWTHWMLTFNGSTAKLYRNGSFIGSPSTYRSFVGHLGSWVISGWAADQYGGYALPYSNFAHFAYWNGVEKSSTDAQNMYNLGAY